MSDRVTVRVFWRSGFSQQTECGAFAPTLLMPVIDKRSRYGFRPVAFKVFAVELPDNWHGPFESMWWRDEDTGRVKMAMYREAV